MHKDWPAAKTALKNQSWIGANCVNERMAAIANVLQVGWQIKNVLFCGSQVTKKRAGRVTAVTAG